MGYEHAVVSDQNSSLYILGGMNTDADKFKDHEATCIDSCEEKDCGAKEVCTVVPRGEEVKKAKPSCLSCDHKKTKLACEGLKQCKWSAEHEVCRMRCSASKSQDKCDAVDHCAWENGECTPGD